MLEVEIEFYKDNQECKDCNYSPAVLYKLVGGGAVKCLICWVEKLKPIFFPSIKLESKKNVN